MITINSNAKISPDPYGESEMRPEKAKKNKNDTASSNRAEWAAKFYEKKVNVRALFRDFVALKNTVKATSNEMDKHGDKCRYSDIYCLDSTRVILQERSPDNDFIHANWMLMPDGFKYISTQGPLDETIEDFWHMVVTEKVANILMICNFCEGVLIKCAQYIPLENKEFRKCGDYKVRRISKVEQPMENVKFQTFEITHRSNKNIRSTVNHYQYLNWPDHIAPSSPDNAIKLYRIFRDPSNTHPVVVHCSAGIGRTATFIGIDYAYQRISQNPQLEMLDIIRELRKMRAKSVQTHHQFVFMIICLTELFISEGVTKNEHMGALLDFYKVRIDRTTKKKEKEEKKSLDV